MMNTKYFSSTLSSVFLGSILAGALAITGCSGTGQESAPAATQQTAGTIAPVAVNTHGRVKMVGDALSQVSLRADQRAAIEQMATDAETRHQAAQKAHVDIMNTLADQVQAGALDRTVLQPKIDAAVAAHQATAPQDRAAFQKLHDLLDASQREAFITAMQTNMQSHHQQHLNAKTAAAATATAAAPATGEEEGAPPAHFGGGHLKKLAAELNLSDAQVSQIKDIMHAQFAGGHGMRDFAGMHDRADNFMESFKADTFNVDQAAPQGDLKAKVAEGSSHMLDVTEKILPLLTADQRKLAADKIREHAANGGPGGHMGIF